jgi:hypothetical protein
MFTAPDALKVIGATAVPDFLITTPAYVPAYTIIWSPGTAASAAA